MVLTEVAIKIIFPITRSCSKYFSLMALYVTQTGAAMFQPVSTLEQLELLFPFISGRPDQFEVPLIQRFSDSEILVAHIRIDVDQGVQ